MHLLGREKKPPFQPRGCDEDDSTHIAFSTRVALFLRVDTSRFEWSSVAMHRNRETSILSSSCIVNVKKSQSHLGDCQSHLHLSIFLYIPPCVLVSEMSNVES